jgi:hypothetical protein
MSVASTANTTISCKKSVGFIVTSSVFQISSLTFRSCLAAISAPTGAARKRAINPPASRVPLAGSELHHETINKHSLNNNNNNNNNMSTNFDLAIDYDNDFAWLQQHMRDNDNDEQGDLGLHDPTTPSAGVFLISNCHFIENKQALLLFHSTVIVQDCLFLRNYDSEFGSAIVYTNTENQQGITIVRSQFMYVAIDSREHGATETHMHMHARTHTCFL